MSLSLHHLPIARFFFNSGKGAWTPFFSIPLTTLFFDPSPPCLGLPRYLFSLVSSQLRARFSDFQTFFFVVCASQPFRCSFESFDLPLPLTSVFFHAWKFFLAFSQFLTHFLSFSPPPPPPPGVLVSIRPPFRTGCNARSGFEVLNFPPVPGLFFFPLVSSDGFFRLRSTFGFQLPFPFSFQRSHPALFSLSPFLVLPPPLLSFFLPRCPQSFNSLSFLHLSFLASSTTSAPPRPLQYLPRSHFPILRFLPFFPPFVGPPPIRPI